MVSVETLGDEGREDLISCCKGIADMVAWLDSLDGRPGLEELGNHLHSLPINLDALKKHISYTDDDGYQRNIIKKTEHYEMVAITWKAGQDTPIHDHLGSDCAFLIVEGTSTETIYSLNEDGLAVPIFIPLYNKRESADTISPPTSSAKDIALVVFPTAVGPTITIKIGFFNIIFLSYHLQHSSRA